MAKAKPKASAKSASGEEKATGAPAGSMWSTYVALIVGVLVLVVALVVAASGSTRQGAESSQSAAGVTEETGNLDGTSAGDKPVKEVVKTKKPAQTKAKKVPVVQDGPYKWNPKTLSVVLPCAGEGLFAKKTVMSVADSVPGGIGGGILEDIVVVDDGSQPPLEKDFITQEFRKEYPVKLVRHKKAVGLMGAKSAGAAKASGDVIVFFDCHVAPQDSWYREFLESIATNYRRIVVPVITNLDIDTWKEVNRNQGFAKCYLTWDADFKWVESTTPFMPVLSGGLLGISKRWWNETGGYDDGMSGWGGENVDQSLRSWLCGGEIVSLPNAFVAHMREDPRTVQNYEVSGVDSVKNKARAVLAWFDDFRNKAAQYPAMSYVGLLDGQQSQVDLNRDVSNFEEEFRSFLGILELCSMPLMSLPFLISFSSISRFPFIDCRFKESGVSGSRSPHNCRGLWIVLALVSEVSLVAILVLCDSPEMARADSHSVEGNLLVTFPMPKSARSWNTDQCLVTQLVEGGMVQTHVCDVSGKQDSAGELAKLAKSLRRVLILMLQLVTTNRTGHSVTTGHCKERCLVRDKKAGRDGSLKVDQMKLVECSKAAKNGPRWEKLDAFEPLETQLYEKALKATPEIFVE
ncbi:Galntl5 [Symbiodinium natans]|uniref:Galntl5 protein n=1 Tax=Symbiodinium natans TaxID=878477 RepID=A0A812NYY7_9DINO|nr:Galntl5 [Symbiodinium natans]